MGLAGGYVCATEAGRLKKEDGESTTATRKPSGAEGKRVTRRLLRLQVLWAVLGAALLHSTGAEAQTYTFGSTMTGTFTSSPLLPAPVFNRAIANAVSPVTGAVVGWSVRGGEGGPLFLQVLHPGVGVNEYVAGAKSAAGSPSTAGVEHFTTDLPIQAGDTVGIGGGDGAHVGATGQGPRNNFWGFASALSEGTAAFAEGENLIEFPGFTGLEVFFNAEVQPTPTVTAVGPTVGPAAGGTGVLIVGDDLERVESVTFGGIPASFQEVTENYLAAYAPANTPAVGVPVTVKTAAGRVTAAEQFVYQPLPESPGDPEDPDGPSEPSPPEPGGSSIEEEVSMPTVTSTPATGPTASSTPAASNPVPLQAAGSAKCIVPNLTAAKLKSARSKARAADCKIAKVTKTKTEKTGKVVAQSPKPGTVLAAGAGVNVKLG
jgi:hypothetical protein